MKPQPAACVLALLTAIGAAGQEALKQGIGRPGDWKNTLAGAVLDGKLYTVEKSGALYVTDPADGSRRSSGTAGAWAATVAGAALGPKLWTVESSGALYVTDAASGQWTAVGRSGFDGVRLMFAAGDALLAIEEDGNKAMFFKKE